MIRLFTIAVLIALHPAPQVKLGSIEGAVVSGPSRQPVSGALVRLIPLNPTPGASVALPIGTDTSGFFRFWDLSPGSYRIRVFAAGFGPQEYGAKSSGGGGFGAGTVLEIAPGQSSRMQVHLNPASVISGRLVNTAGDPLVGIEVVLLQPRYDEFGERVFFPEAVAFSDDRGEYHLPEVGIGRYRVCSGSLSVDTAALPTPSSAPGSGVAAASFPRAVSPGTYAPSCYPGHSTPEEASDIQITGQTEIRAVDFQLVQQPLYRLRGRVVMPGNDKMPDPPPQVGIRRQLSLATTFRRRPVAADGSFEIMDVAPGSYAVTAVAPVSLKPLTPAGSESPPQITPGGAVAVSVVNSDLSDTVIMIVPGVPVSGRIRGDEEPLSEATLGAVQMTLQRTRTGGEREMPVVKASAVRSDGSFEFLRLSQGVNYRLVIGRLPPGFYVKQAQLGNVNLLKGPFQLYGSAADSIQVTLSRKGGQVEGVVTDEQMVPVAKAQVVLVPVPADQEHHRFVLTTTDAGGQFVARNLEPGEYRIFAWRELEPFAYFEAELLQRFQDRSLSIHVAESSLVKTAVRVMPQP